MEINDKTTSEDLASHLNEVSSKDLSKLSQATLLRIRQLIPADDKEKQNKVAGPEHRAFAREVTTEEPLMALPIALAALAYTPAKALGIVGGRSDASLSQMGDGLSGVVEGLTNYSATKVEAMKQLLSNL